MTADGSERMVGGDIRPTDIRVVLRVRAAFYLINGALNHEAVLSNLALDAPRVLSWVMPAYHLNVLAAGERHAATAMIASALV